MSEWTRPPRDTKADAARAPIAGRAASSLAQPADRQRQLQNRVASLPGLRRIARRNARDLFRINAGFLYSQVLFAAVESGLLTRLKDGGRSADALSAACGFRRPRWSGC
ncbi:MAG: hypothetical protein HPM95_05805 [Alphaproteobacteria bacterium]|nr:hypothetical protein [Alphaproteobacteria bacterium]